MLSTNFLQNLAWPLSSYSRIGDVVPALECGDDGIPKVFASAADGAEIKPEIGRQILPVIPVDAETNFRSAKHRSG